MRNLFQRRIAYPDNLAFAPRKKQCRTAACCFAWQAAPIVRDGFPTCLFAFGFEYFPPQGRYYSAFCLLGGFFFGVRGIFAFRFGIFPHILVPELYFRVFRLYIRQKRLSLKMLEADARRYFVVRKAWDGAGKDGYSVDVVE